ncbi:hypothetical protein HPB50_025121 [Hyalomma asiaticum]|uniref:Uncharacterized protein n=1 Tax=Hyalomma asiaticum TaxID=266040 RepID=A0ACB7RSL4_HYAAI|nr:hypothetical protein HPB50_025121 [Hyalomma asiaticum]
MTSGHSYKLRDHPDFLNDISIPFYKELRPELICTACNCITPAGVKDKQGHVFCRKCAATLTDDTNQFTCYLCDWSGPLISTHYEKCDMKGKVRCTLCNSVQGIKAIGDHMINDCPKRLVECAFCNADVAACDKLAARRDMQVHEAGRNNHNDLLVRKVCQLERENQDLRKTQHEMLKTLTETYEDKIQFMERKLAEHQQSASAEKEIRSDLGKQLLKLQQELEALTTKQNTDSFQLSEQIAGTENALERLASDIHLEPVKPGFVYVWKVQPYSALKNAAITSTEEISSGELYINKPGYHVEFSVGFIRSSTTSSPQLSFKCRICPGIYDDMLPWPFSGKIIVILVNHLEEQASRCFELDVASAEHAVECLRKPEPDQRNPRFGYPQIISIPLLENVKKGFLFQNCIVFKVVVHSF